MMNMSMGIFSSDDELTFPPLFDILEDLDGELNSGGQLLDSVLLPNTPSFGLPLPLAEVPLHNTSSNNTTSTNLAISNPVPLHSSAPVHDYHQHASLLHQPYLNEQVLSRPEDLIPSWPLESCNDSSTSFPAACPSYMGSAMMDEDPQLASRLQGTASPSFHPRDLQSSADISPPSSSSSSSSCPSPSPFSSSQELASDLPVGIYFSPVSDYHCSSSPQLEFAPLNLPLVFDPSSPSSGVDSPLSSSISSPLQITSDIGFMSLYSPCPTRPPSSMDSEISTDNENAFEPQFESPVDSYPPYNSDSPSYAPNFYDPKYATHQFMEVGPPTMFASSPSDVQTCMVDVNQYPGVYSVPMPMHARNFSPMGYQYYCENGHDGNYVEMQLNHGGNGPYYSPANMDVAGDQVYNQQQQLQQKHHHQHQQTRQQPHHMPLNSRAIQYLPEYISVPPHVRAEYNNVLAELTSLAPSFLASNDPRKRAEYHRFHNSLSKVRPPTTTTNNDNNKTTHENEGEEQVRRVQMQAEGIKKLLGLPQRLCAPTKAAPGIRKIPSRTPTARVDQTNACIRGRGGNGNGGSQVSEYSQQYRDTLARIMHKKATKRSADAVVEPTNSLDTIIKGSKIIRLTHAYQQCMLDPPSPAPVPNPKKRKTKKDVIENIHKQIPEFSSLPTPPPKANAKKPPLNIDGSKLERIFDGIGLSGGSTSRLAKTLGRVTN